MDEKKYTKAQLHAGTKAVRKLLDESGYGGWVSDEQCEKTARAVLEAALGK